MDQKIPILLVDDRHENLLSLEELLCDDGYELVKALSGNEALLLTLKKDFALLLMDVQMPEMSGFETAELLRLNPKTKHLPIIFVTAGMKDLQFQFKGYDVGAVDYLAKPIEPQILKSKVQVFSKLYQQRCELESHKKHLEELVNLRTAELQETAAELEISNDQLRQHRQNLLKMNEELEEWIEEEVRKSREKDILLLQQDKLASIGQLAAGVAHEINNPMGFITSNLATLKGYAESINQFCALLRDMAETNSNKEELEVLKQVIIDLDIDFILEDIAPLITQSTEGADRVKQIVLDLKDFAKTEDTCFELTSLNDCIRSTANMVNNEIKYVADLVLQLADIPEITCSRHQINQVLVNLLLNAGHAIEKHGTITVITRQDGDQVAVSINDTGCGMTNEVKKRVFDPFFTTKKVGDGTGLGLSISYGIIKKHGGDIKVESEPGIGTTFTVTLPINARQAE